MKFPAEWLAMSLGTINFPPTIRGLGPRASVGHGPLQSPWTLEFSDISVSRWNKVKIVTEVVFQVRLRCDLFQAEKKITVFTSWATDKLFHSKWSKLLFWVKIVVILSVAQLVKFRFSEKATKFEKISHLFWRYWVKTAVSSKQVGDFFSNFVAFSQCLDFKNSYFFLSLR